MMLTILKNLAKIELNSQLESMTEETLKNFFKDRNAIEIPILIHRDSIEAARLKSILHEANLALEKEKPVSEIKAILKGGL